MAESSRYGHSRSGKTCTGSAAEVCEIHRGKRIAYFCTAHGEYCCVSCKCEEHRQCSDIARINKPAHAKFLREFDASFPGDEHTPAITDSAFLPDSRLLLIDRDNKKLKVFGPDFKFLYGKHFENKPYNLAVYGEKEVAVSFGGACQVCRLAIERPIRDIRTLHVNMVCLGITYIDSKTFVALGREENVAKLLHVNGEQLRQIGTNANDSFFKGPTFCCMSDTKRTLFVTNNESNAVLGLDLNSDKEQFTYKYPGDNDDGKGAQGIAVDRYGYIYVCYAKSNSIHQISSTGAFISVLLSEEDGIKHPWTISFDHFGKRQRFVVAGGINKIVKVFELEY